MVDTNPSKSAPLGGAHRTLTLFLVVGFLLLAFVVPLGVAFVVTAIAAGQMDPKAADDFIVPLRQEPPDFGEDK